MTGRRPVALAVTGAAVLVAGLAGCTDDDPSPTPTAEALAAALDLHGAPPEAPDDSAVDGAALAAALADVPFAGSEASDVAADIAAALGPLGDLGRSVEVGAVVLDQPSAGDGDPATATATLDWSWDVSSAVPWQYSTQVTLELAESAGTEAAADAEAWQVDWSADALVPGLVAGDTLRLDRVAAERAGILDRDGDPIVEERPVERFGIDKTHIDADDQEDSARALADGFGYDADAFAAQVAAAGDKAFVELVTLREDEAQAAAEWARRIPGVNVLADTMPLAPSKGFAAPLLGRAGEATAEAIEDSDGSVEAGDVVGLSGLQAAADEQLRGAPGVTVSVVHGEGLDGTTDGDDEIFSTEPVAGVPLSTTLDVDNQLAAEQVLADVDGASAIVAIDVPTGDVLAAASGPGATATRRRHSGSTRPARP
ncbi:hypothetical protein GCM10025865_10120 [Paraoerskovia sediminicola]|uniref:beta-lactamase n=1 Tax=Paraoerskovia sediminicola TaxID=1138587 RepID=A0ABN6XA25_9CELL|nr:hypothetical protein [Paraoerskovia sediminicola]BDZ41713.1 hypothetical protein GCM10025865_10120 [Paraoerskovia sediminicola]